VVLDLALVPVVLDLALVPVVLDLTASTWLKGRVSSFAC
jgi:hypothetical protein